MKIDINNLQQSIEDSLKNIHFKSADKMPDIKLYMDQIVTYIDEMLAESKTIDDDKILTKTMVNNYVKSGLLPAPEKKRYSKNHIIALVFIYYLKNIISVSDTERLLVPIHDRFFEVNEGTSLTDIYELVSSLEVSTLDSLNASLQNDLIISKDAVASISDLNEEESDYLEKFVFICLLSFDIYVKKQIIENIIWSMGENPFKKEEPESKHRHHKKEND